MRDLRRLASVGLARPTGGEGEATSMTTDEFDTAIRKAIAKEMQAMSESDNTEGALTPEEFQAVRAIHKETQAMGESDETKEWTVHMRVEYDADVLIEAATAEEARAKAESGDWIDDGIEGASRADWGVRGEPKECK
jgi:hypothetical protein